MKNIYIILFSLTLTGTILAQSPRLSLYEEFTGENCGPCASTNPALNNMLGFPSVYSKVVAIKWQVPIPSAPSYTWSLYKTNQAEIDWRYSIYGYGINSAPSGLLDGQNCSVFGAQSNHPVYLSPTVVNAAQGVPSSFSVSMQREWNATGTAVNLTVNIEATDNFNAVGNLRFRTVMVEERIEFATAPGSNGEKVFEWAAIKSFPDIQNGIAMASNWTIGQTQSFTLNCPIPSYTRKKTEIAFVGFIQDDGNRKVAQAFRLEKELLTYDAEAVSAKSELTCSDMLSPVVTVKNNGVSALTDLTITPYVDGNVLTPVSWSGNVATGGTVQVPMNIQHGATLNGSHTFSAVITGMNGADFEDKNNSTRADFMLVSNYQDMPVLEDFDAGDFPKQSWVIINSNGGPGWAKYNNSGAYNRLGSKSIRYEFFKNTVAGDKDELILPPVDLRGNAVPVLSYDKACAMRQGVEDGLDIMVSEDCGVTWTKVFGTSGAGLATLQNPVNTEYYPSFSDSTQWQYEFIPLPNHAKANILVKFVAIAGGNGNNLYLDNINLVQSAHISGIAELEKNSGSLTTYPNPSGDRVTVTMNTIAGGHAGLKLYNSIGQEVQSFDLELRKGVNKLHIDVSGLSTGVYQLTLNTAAANQSAKLFINH